MYCNNNQDVVYRSQYMSMLLRCCAFFNVRYSFLTGRNRGTNTAVAWFGAHVVVSIKLIIENVIE